MTICDKNVINNTGSNRNIIFSKHRNFVLMHRYIHGIFFAKKAKFWKNGLDGIEFSTLSTDFSTAGAFGEKPTFLCILVDISENCNL